MNIDLDDMAAAHAKLTGMPIDTIKIATATDEDRIEILDWCVMHEVRLIEVDNDLIETVLHRP